jgi:glycosyltransferase involved in cell wall biosynthesis
MRVMIYATSPLVGSGYATATRYVAKGLKNRGHDVANFAWNSHAGRIFNWDGVPIYPRANTLNGFDGLAPYCRHFDADLILAICDPWVMNEPQWRSGHDCPVVYWFPCQSEPASRTLVNIVKTGDAALCYSRWGTDAMRKAGAENVQYCPLGVDTSVYKPQEKKQARRELVDLGFDLTDRFFAVMVAANASTVPIGRKAFDQALLAWRDYVHDYDSDAILYIHTWPGAHQGGMDLHPLVAHLGLEDNVYFPSEEFYLLGLSDEWMAKLYASADVAIQATTAEGFGLPVLEAQACGTPVVTTDYSSMPELTAHGIAVGAAARLWAPSPMDGWVCVPDVKEIVDAIADIRKGTEKDSRQAGLDLAESLTWDRVIDDHLLPALEAVSLLVEA